MLKCIMMRTCWKTFTLQAFLCVQTTTLHEYLSATFSSPYHMLNSAPRSNQTHSVLISAPRSHLYITHVHEPYNFKLGCHKSKIKCLKIRMTQIYNRMACLKL